MKFCVRLLLIFFFYFNLCGQENEKELDKSFLALLYLGQQEKSQAWLEQFSKSKQSSPASLELYQAIYLLYKDDNSHALDNFLAMAIDKGLLTQAYYQLINKNLEDYYLKNNSDLTSIEINLKRMVKVCGKNNELFKQLQFRYWIYNKNDVLIDDFLSHSKNDSRRFRLANFYWLIIRKEYKQAWDYFDGNQDIDGKDSRIVTKILLSLLNQFTDEEFSDFADRVIIYLQEHNFSAIDRILIEQKLFEFYFEKQNYNYLINIFKKDKKLFKQRALNLLTSLSEKNPNKLLMFCQFLFSLDIDEGYLKNAMLFQLTSLFKKKQTELLVISLDSININKKFSLKTKEDLFLLGGDFLFKLKDYNNALKIFQKLLKSQNNEILIKINYFITMIAYEQNQNELFLSYAKKYLMQVNYNYQEKDLELYYALKFVEQKNITLNKIESLNILLNKRQSYNYEALVVLNNYFKNTKNFDNLRIKILTLMIAETEKYKDNYEFFYDRSLLYFMTGERQKAYEDITQYLKWAKEDEAELAKLYELQFLSDEVRRQKSWKLMKSKNAQLRILAFEQLLLTIKKNKEINNEIVSNFTNDLYDDDIYLRWLQYIEEKALEGSLSFEEVKSSLKIVNHFLKLNKGVYDKQNNYYKYLIFFCKFHYFDDWEETSFLKNLWLIYREISLENRPKVRFLIAQIYEKKHLVKSMQESYQYAYFSAFSTSFLRQKVLQKNNIRNFQKNKEEIGRTDLAFENGYFKIAQEIYEEIYKNIKIKDYNDLFLKITQCFFYQGHYEEGKKFLLRQEVKSLLLKDKKFEYNYLLNLANLQLQNGFIESSNELKKVITDDKQRYYFERLMVSYWVKQQNYSEIYKLIDKHLSLLFLTKSEKGRILLSKVSFLRQEKKYQEAFEFLKKNQSYFVDNDVMFSFFEKIILLEKLGKPVQNLVDLKFKYIDYEIYSTINSYLTNINDVVTKLAILKKISKQFSDYQDEFLLEEINILNKEGKVKEVIEKSLSVITKFPKFENINNIYFILAENYAKQKQYKKAIKAIDEILVLTTVSHSFIIKSILLKVSFLTDDKWQEKLAILEKETEYKISDKDKKKIATVRANATFIYANLTNNIKAYEKAAQYYLELSLLDGSQYDYIRTICLLRSGDYGGVHQLISGDILSKEKSFLKSLTYYYQKNYVNAKKKFQEIINKYPDTEEGFYSFYFLTNIIVFQDQNKKEFELLQKNLFSNFINYYNFRNHKDFLNYYSAYCLWFMKDYKLAQKYWQRLKNLPDVQFWLAYNQLFIKEKYRTELLEVLQKYSKENTGQLTQIAKFQSGYLKFLKGNYNSTLLELNELTKEVDENKSITLEILIASLTCYLGEYDKSKELINKLIERKSILKLDDIVNKLYNKITLAWFNNNGTLEAIADEVLEKQQTLYEKNKSLLFLYGKAKLYKTLVNYNNEKNDKKWSQLYVQTLQEILKNKIQIKDNDAKDIYCLAGYDLIDYYFLVGEFDKSKNICELLSASGYPNNQLAIKYLNDWNK